MLPQWQSPRIIQRIVEQTYRHCHIVVLFYFFICWCDCFFDDRDIEMLALFVSCLCHDLDHRGTTNSFQVSSVRSLALFAVVLVYDDGIWNVFPTMSGIISRNCCIFLEYVETMIAGNNPDLGRLWRPHANQNAAAVFTVRVASLCHRSRRWPLFTVRKAQSWRCVFGLYRAPGTSSDITLYSVSADAGSWLSVPPSFWCPL